MSSPLQPLLHRHSVPTAQLGEPAPDAATLRALLDAAIRVPDHGKLVPFRLILLRGQDKLRFGERLAELAEARDPELPDSKREKERRRYTYAPLVVVVVARIDAGSKVPEIEQRLSAGCVAYNLLVGGGQGGVGARGVNGWGADDTQVAGMLGLAAHEHVTGFVHLGTPQLDVPDRDRPALDELLSTWQA